MYILNVCVISHTKSLFTMFITITDISTLKELSTSKDLVSVKKIPNSFKVDFNAFFSKIIFLFRLKNLFA